MDQLWGEFLPVDPGKINVLQDNMEIRITNKLTFHSLDTPGHAGHHMTYRLDNVLFSGDVGGVRIPGSRHLRVPMPPPEFNLEKWHLSANRLKREVYDNEIEYIAPTHFGLYDDPQTHIENLENALQDIQAWIESSITGEDTVDSITEKFLFWTRERSTEAGINDLQLNKYEAANPSWMSPAGIYRYLRKKK